MEAGPGGQTGSGNRPWSTPSFFFLLKKTFQTRFCVPKKWETSVDSHQSQFRSGWDSRCRRLIGKRRRRCRWHWRRRRRRRQCHCCCCYCLTSSSSSSSSLSPLPVPLLLLLLLLMSCVPILLFLVLQILVAALQSLSCKSPVTWHESSIGGFRGITWSPNKTFLRTKPSQNLAKWLPGDGVSPVGPCYFHFTEQLLSLWGSFSMEETPRGEGWLYDG